MAEKLNCDSILGIDIDLQLIKRANDSLAYRQRKFKREHNGNVASDEHLNKVIFRVENYIENPISTEQFDIITCMSVTKWIHLNWGDAGIITLFNKVYSSLPLGGKFIVEPQDWKSYKKKRNLTEIIYQNYKTIKLRPDDFPKVLKDTGFTSVDRIDQNQQKDEDKNTTGFERRPIYICSK